MNRCTPTSLGWAITVSLALLLSSSFAQLQICDQSVPIRELSGIPHVPLSLLIQACGGRQWRVVEPTGQQRIVAVIPAKDQPTGVIKETEFVFWPEKAIIRAGEQEIILPAPVRLESDGLLYIPVAALPAILPEFTPALPALALTGVYSLRDTAFIKLGVAVPETTMRKPRTAARRPPIWHGVTKSSLEYQLAVAARCDSGAVQQIRLIPPLTGNNLIESVRVENAGGTTIHFQFRRPTTVKVSAETSGILIKAWPRPEKKVRSIVLDPGHGGPDPGAMSPSGTKEKDIVLDIALRIRPKLEAAGLEVILTREKDELVTLSDRSKLTNTKKADLFVSIHANAALNRKACGLETYFLSESKTDWERAVAARENAALEFELADSIQTKEELELILADLAQNEFLLESSELAAHIQEQTLPLARIANRGVRQANFFVLRNNYRPAVLVECGFITNRSEEKLLNDPLHRERLAEGITQGILAFIRQYERRINGI